MYGMRIIPAGDSMPSSPAATISILLELLDTSSREKLAFKVWLHGDRLSTTVADIVSLFLFFILHLTVHELSRSRPRGLEKSCVTPNQNDE